MAKIVSFSNYKNRNIVTEEGSSKGRVQIVYSRSIFEAIKDTIIGFWYSIL